MSSWFDKLLEELQRRQQEADARREGRPFPREERNVTPIDEAARGRRGRQNGGDGKGTGTAGAGSLRWPRSMSRGGGG